MEKGQSPALAPDHADKRLFWRDKESALEEHLDPGGDCLGLLHRLFAPLPTGQRHPETAATAISGLPKTQLGARHQGQRLANPLIADVLAVAFPQHHGGGARPELGDGAYRQPRMARTCRANSERS